MTEEIRGLDLPRLRAWLADHVEGAEGPLDFERVAAGGSNLTYRVEAEDGRRWALRRPPVAARIATAHDMGREWKVLAALHAHPAAGVPVPEPVARCDDESVLGARFYVMGFSDGLILRGPEEAAPLDADQCRTAAESLIDVQVALHTLEPDAVGLGDLGRREGYLERQLERWRKQYALVQTREIPLVDELHALLSSKIPPQQRVGLVHGDYRFDNTVLGPDCRIAAVLDWELCTLGDPVADFVWSILYWSDPDDPPEEDFGATSPTRHPRFPRRAEVIEMYAKRSGLDLSDRAYYETFSWWKMACLVEGVVARIRGGASGGLGGTSADEAIARVDRMFAKAAETAARL